MGANVLKVQESINRPFEFGSPAAKDVKPYQGIAKTTPRNGFGSRMSGHYK